MEGNAMSAFLTSIGLVVTQSITWIGNVATLIVSEPLFLFTTGFLALGACVSLVGRVLAKS